MNEISPLNGVLLSTGFTFLLTLLGSLVVFFVPKINKKFLNFIMCFSGGIMIASSIFSLLIPALEDGKFISPSIGFFIGGLFIIFIDLFIVKKLEKNSDNNLIDKDNTKLISLISAVSLHNLPEGMAIGISFGLALVTGSNEFLLSSFILAFGIGIQNIPEGACISLPMHAKGHSKFKSFIVGTVSDIFEPIGGVIGFYFVTVSEKLLPFLLSFAAGSMVVVVCSELIPDSVNEHKIISILGLLTGFILMMILDVAFA